MANTSGETAATCRPIGLLQQFCRGVTVGLSEDSCYNVQFAGTIEQVVQIYWTCSVHAQ